MSEKKADVMVTIARLRLLVGQRLDTPELDKYLVDAELETEHLLKVIHHLLIADRKTENPS